MSRRSSRILAVLGVVFLAAGVAATMQDDGRRWKVHDKNRPQPPMVTPGMESTGERPGTAPSDAIVLLSADTGLDAWSNGKWTFSDGVMQVTPGTGDTLTKDSFGDCQFHIEWMIPEDRECNGRWAATAASSSRTGSTRSRSSVRTPTRPIPTARPGDVRPVPAAGQSLPAERPVERLRHHLHRPRFAEDGSLVAPATATVIFNGVVVQIHYAFMGLTSHGSKAKYSKHDTVGRIKLQDHGDPIRFANIWVRPLPDRAPAW